MLKPHCDNCEKLLADSAPSWAEMTDGKIWHIAIYQKTPSLDFQFCVACRRAILERYLAILKDERYAS